ncbi:MAG: hypothetical protein IT381_02345 [Deltaproteobacteria bacterium]|nr:hypothetical protein [Deltaproteobacteria bacterium]
MPVPIDDAVECTIDSCDSTTGVRHAPLAAGTACGIGNTNVCQGIEACDGAGACVALPPPESALCPRTIMSNDPLISLARLDLAAGAAPLSQSFALQVSAVLAPGQRFDSNFGPLVAASYAIDFDPVGHGGDYLFPATTPCTVATIPFDLTRYRTSPAAVLAQIAVYQVLDRAGGGVTLASMGVPIAVDTVTGTVSVCVSHLSILVATLPATCQPVEMSASAAGSGHVALAAPVPFVLPDEIESSGILSLVLTFFDETSHDEVRCGYVALSGDAQLIACLPARQPAQTYFSRTFSLDFAGLVGSFARWSVTNPAVSCADRGYDCGITLDQCGGYADCGPAQCPGLYSCTANVCSGCTPTTCAREGVACGRLWDECSLYVSCGTCSAREGECL